MEEMKKVRERLMTSISKLNIERDVTARRLDMIDAETQGLRYAVDNIDSAIAQLEKKEKNV